MQTTGRVTQDQISPESIMDRLYRQLESDTASGVIGQCSEAEMKRVVTTSVHALWNESRIKTFVPVLALRRARDEIRALDTAQPGPA
jgi:hypothetical protein